MAEAEAEASAQQATAARPRNHTEPAILQFDENKEDRACSDSVISPISPSALKGSRSSSGGFPKRRLSWQGDQPEIANTSAGSEGSAPVSPSSPTRRISVGAGMLSGFVDGGLVGRMMTEPHPGQKQKIDDRRGDASPADHNRIIRSFSQGLAGVETVIVYEVNKQEWHSSDDHEGETAKSVFWMHCAHCLAGLGATCLSMCGCATLIDRESATQTSQSSESK